MSRQSSEVQEDRCRTSRRINEETEFKITKGILMIRGLLKRISLQARKPCEMEFFFLFVFETMSHYVAMAGLEIGM